MDQNVLKLKFIIIAIFCGQLSILGQGIRIENDRVGERLLQIFELKEYNQNDFFSSIKFNDSKALVDTLIKLYPLLSPSEKIDAENFINQYNYFYEPEHNTKNIYSDSTFYYVEKTNEVIIKKQNPILKYFYTSPYHLYHLNTPKLSLIIDPILDFNVGRDLKNNITLFQNTRGARVSGYIDKKVYFYSQILENQTRFPYFVEDYIQQNLAIPGNGFYKDYQSNVLDNLNGRDFLNASGYLGVPISKSVSLDFGHGRHFIGNGMRSLLLSDFSNNYFYLKLNTKVWKFHYQNIFAELSATGSNDILNDVLIPKKYMASHYLTIKPWRNLEVGLFESVIFSRENHFEFQYLNPVILYRAIEQSLGSPDNALLGININWTLLNKIKLYGQVAIDEFKLSQLNTGWWGNKFGGQIGLNYLNAFNIENLDIQLESNIVRPFTYAQSRAIEAKPEYSISSYSNFNQALAHPLGANFRELIGRVSYRPTPKLAFQLVAMYYEKGLDFGNENFGGNILLNTESKTNTFDNFVGQGLKEKVNYFQLRTTYQLYQNLLLDLNTIYRTSTVNNSNNYNKFLNLNIGVRYHITPTNNIF